jgi:hypothetical protein
MITRDSMSLHPGTLTKNTSCLLPAASLIFFFRLIPNPDWNFRLPRARNGVFRSSPTPTLHRKVTTNHENYGKYLKVW